ncbi:NO-inducible flavohemoprotein [Aquibacillus albus]|uniref:Flavohemoprotein n=1 Tax=Aquibacillus albus TaxID=1168171 RepID=A0ABS2N3E2_9BACI|nr:NO-inducible flavohemoprotein [Aquibacillus albus]MBM7572629.1 nitric oxide dioxygenase [Aquibacillus albus]
MTVTTRLDEKTIEIVKSTAPVLEKHGEAITKRFYPLMFENHPELLHVFNHANQQQGKQQKALANTVYAAAKYIDHLEAIVPVVKQIAHKHRSLQVKPEQYPIVGEHLLLAIKDVLGDAATDEILEAWGKAYGVIADVFIQVEKEMYEEAAEKKGGWDGFRDFVVAKKVKESDAITSFYLKPKDGKAISEYLPGQYVSIRCYIEGETYTHIRQYSLSDAPGKDYYRISVKREADSDIKPDGIVSNYLHDQISEGDVVELTAPAGDFVLNMDSFEPVVLISGGVGQTPMLSMLNTIVEQQPSREVTFIHAAINGDFHAMDNEVTELANNNENVNYFLCYENPTDYDREQNRFDKEGYVELEWLQQILPDNQADFYFCGPVPFMKVIKHGLKAWNVPEEKIHFEFFGPADQLD